ncbi:cation-translocating P-type ATPase [Pontibacter sp. MBLB2868]|uniref:cation-translocating P-type ATPase n=1 Tax=Pontibacter sp. MBLB2868 TaxID=3451555 RepID=UPI003F75067B
MTEQTTINTEWNSLKSDELVIELDTGTEGLTEAEAAERQIQYGLNVLPERKKILLWQVVVHQFKSSIIYVLLAAGVVSFLVGEYSDAGFIFLVLVINAALGATQEWKAEKSAAALQKLIKVQAKVKRNGQVKIIGSEELVPGDFVYLESGNKVPADIRLLKANQLTTEEALLTGESLPVGKNDLPVSMSGLPVTERKNTAFAGTTVMNGRGRGVVVATGMYTEIGMIASSLTEMKATKPPLVHRMERFARRISVVVLGACLVLGLIGFIEGIPLIELFLFMIAIAVSAIPEGLPVAMTVALSIGTTRMARRNVIVRKLTAVEGLGSCTYIATDKTGTLTVDQQTARIIVLRSGEMFTITGEGYAGIGEIQDEKKQAVNLEKRSDLVELIEQVNLCNEAALDKSGEEWLYQGDPIDVALLALAYKAGRTPKQFREQVEVWEEIPFESERKYAATYYKKQGENYLAVKGAIEALSNYTSQNDTKALADKAYELACKGYRIIAVGHVKGVTPLSEGNLPPISLLGFVALIDPIRPEAKAAIAVCHAARVHVAMVTGDHPATALSIAQELHIANGTEQVITGPELGMPAEELDDLFLEKVRGKRVFARVTPQQKQKIVEALEKIGHFVAVTGDGVNDAPALKTGNIGVAMGYGTDVAKETASIIITDNNFASIAAGIEEGRYTYSNIRKIVYLLISTGAAEVLMVALALAFDMPLPFLPVQLLWLNLVTNGIQDIGLGFEKGERGIMKKPPRSPSEAMFNPLMIQEVLVSGVVIALIAFGVWYYLLELRQWPEAAARNAVLLLMVLLENFHVLNCRSETRSIFHIPLKNNLVLIIGMLVSQLIHIISMHIPFMQRLLSLQPVSPAEWAEWLGLASLILVVMEIFKWVKRRQKAQFPEFIP